MMPVQRLLRSSIYFTLNKSFSLLGRVWSEALRTACSKFKKLLNRFKVLILFHLFLLVGMGVFGSDRLAAASIKGVEYHVFVLTRQFHHRHNAIVLNIFQGLSSICECQQYKGYQQPGVHQGEMTTSVLITYGCCCDALNHLALGVRRALLGSYRMNHENRTDANEEFIYLQKSVLTTTNGHFRMMQLPSIPISYSQIPM